MSSIVPTTQYRADPCCADRQRPRSISLVVGRFAFCVVFAGASIASAQPGLIGPIDDSMRPVEVDQSGPEPASASPESNDADRTTTTGADPIVEDPILASLAARADAEDQPIGGLGTVDQLVPLVTKNSTQADGTGVGRTALALGGVLSLILLLAAVGRKLSRRAGVMTTARAPSGIMTVLGRYPMARGQSLLLLQVGERILVVAQTLPGVRGRAGSMTTLCELDEPGEVATVLSKVRDNDGDSLASKFRTLLTSFDPTDDAPDAELYAEPESDSWWGSNQSLAESTGPEFAAELDSGAAPDPVSALRTRLDLLKSGAGDRTFGGNR